MQITLSQAKPLVLKCLKKKIVPYITSSPGVGKSAMAREIAKDLNLELIDIRLAQCDPVDLNGLPNFVNGKATYVPFDTFPTEGDALPTGKRGWLIIMDELSSAPKALQTAAFKILLDRKVGQKDLHTNVLIMAAGNLATDNAHVMTMATSTQSRLAHFEIKVSKPEFMEWATANNIDSRITSYIEFKPTMLHNFDPKHKGATFACPRTWEFMDRLIQDEPTITAELAPLLNSVVGDGTGTDFRAFCNLYSKIPKLAAIVADPTGIHISEDMGMQYAMAGYISDHLCLANADQLHDFIIRLSIEQQVICIRKAYNQRPDIITNHKIDTWLDKNSARFIK
jgi:hypothetical protein